MTARLRISVALLAACCLVMAAFLIPSYAAAQSGAPLTAQCTGINCQLCHIYGLFNNLIQYAILIASTIAAALFAYAGILLFTSSGSSQKVTQAKDIFRKTFTGFVIALSAFLFVETLVNSIAAGKVNFKSVPCVSNRLLEGEGLGFVSPAEGLIDTATEIGEFTGETAAIGGGPCAVSQLQAAGVREATKMSCICAMESSSQPGAESGTDRLKNDPEKRAFSFGLFQINIVANQLKDCSTGQMVNCPTAFNNTGKTSYDATVKNEALYRRCTEIAKNSSCNIENARRIAQEGPGSGLGNWGNQRNAAACGIPYTFR